MPSPNAKRKAFKTRAKAKQLWSPEETKLLRRKFPRAGNDELAALFRGRTTTAIYDKAHKLGLKRAVGNEWTAEKNELLKRLYTTAEWSAVLKAFPDVARGAITQQAVRLGLKRPERKQESPAVSELRAGLMTFLSRARTDKEVLFKFGKPGIAELAELAKAPPDGYLLKVGKNLREEKTSYLARVKYSADLEIKERIFKLKHADNDPDYIAVIFPKDLDFTDDPEMNGLRIMAFDSVHFGDHLCDMDAFDKHLRYLEEKPYAFAYLNGDIFGKLGYTKFTAEDIRQDLLMRLAPVAHKILWAQSGDYEHALAKVDGIDPLQYVCDELGIHHTSRPVMADVYWKFPTKPVEFTAVHGQSNAVKDGAKANAIITSAITHNFPHVTVLGHLKEALVNTLTVRRLDPAEFRIKEQPAITMICGGFQRYEGSRAERMGQPPPVTGLIAVLIKADNSVHTSA